MEMTSHLTDVELEEFVVNPGKGLGTHLETCPSCLNEVARLRQTVELLRPDPGPPEEFFDRQRRAIRSSIEREAIVGRPQLPRIAWVAATAMILAAVFLLASSPQPTSETVQIDPDHELLIAVERAVHSEVPTALAPAALLAHEIGGSSAAGSLSTILYKEKSHAE